jgi:hypothetical protein
MDRVVATLAERNVRAARREGEDFLTEPTMSQNWLFLLQPTQRPLSEAQKHPVITTLVLLQALRGFFQTLAVIIQLQEQLLRYRS